MRPALRALARGAATVLAAPHLVVSVLLITMMTAAPFGVWLGTRLQQSLAGQSLGATESAEIDPEWWLEFRRHASGLEATFTPAIVGFAAPLSNLSAILDGTAPPAAVVVPVVLAMIVWAFLWGGLLHRFAHGPASMGALLSAALRWWWPFVLIALAAAIVQLLLYVTVHPLLFGPLLGALVPADAPELLAFAARLTMYVVFAAFMVPVLLVADYARVLAAVTGQRSVRVLAADAFQFLRQSLVPVVTLFIAAGLLFVLLLTVYGMSETYGGTRLGGWRAIAIGQAYILARLTLRLITGASPGPTGAAAPRTGIIAVGARRSSPTAGYRRRRSLAARATRRCSRAPRSRG